ncbi:MAG: sulfotransferase [Planctomycetota bacterium]
METTLATTCKEEHESRILDGSAFVFVIGAGRSGTTWVQSLLGSHPEVLACQESMIFSHFLGPCLRQWHTTSREGRDRGIGLRNYLTYEGFAELLKDMFLRVFAEPIRALGRRRFIVDKTPAHATWVPEIIELLPCARFIHVLRDARDAVASLLAAGRSWGASWAPAHPREAALDWQRSVLGAREAIDRLGQGQTAEVRYENLLGDAHAELRRMFDFLGLSYDGKLIDEIVRACEFTKVKREGRSPGISLFGAMRKEGTTRREPEGFFRRGEAGIWRKELSLIDRYYVWRYARKTMRRVGYPWALPL